jgi:energy-coupling factor transporter ATP-binding protein EcfA2
MLRPRIEAVELHRLPHDGAWQLPLADRPVVIAGPNGSGKTTLVEGVVACLFGATGQRGQAGGGVAGRASRRDSDAWCRVELSRGDDRFEVRRDLDTGSVMVRSLGDGGVCFEGDGAARPRTTEGRRYRQLLAQLLGIADAEAYTRTLFVRQGTLLTTRVGEHLLHVAVGGHARVEKARRDIAEAHRLVTARPLHAGDQASLNPRELEKVEEEMAMVRDRLEAARAAGARRAPLALDRDRVGERLRQLTGEIDRLEEAHTALVRGSATEVNARQLKELARKLEQSAAAVPAAADRLAAAMAGAEAAAEDGIYPPDFPERLARAELRWRDLERIAGTPPPWLAGLGVALGLAAALLIWAALPVPAAVVGALALVATTAWVALRFDARRTRVAVAAELGGILAGVPGGAALGPAGRDLALRAFTAQAEALRAVADARQRLADALREARRQLHAAKAAGVAAALPAVWQEGSGAEREAARRMVARIDRALEEAQHRLLRERRELDRVGDVSLQLPDGVVPTEAGVAEALRDRREERRRAQETLQEVGQELLERGTPAESLDALEATLSSLAPRRDALLLKAEVLESAHALLTDAYDSFRASDQDRLVGLISDHAGRLTDGAVGPVVVDGLLEEARVRVGGLLMELRSPPLSFGELHAAFLAVRLGAADFLGGMGVFPPLILDEPFAHLDPDRAAAVWEMLCSVAGERQVIVTTQDTLLLAALHIEPDILLDAARPAAASAEDVEPIPAG